MQHIVYLCSEYPNYCESHGGIGVFVKWISENLVNHGFRISVIGFYDVHSYQIIESNNINFHLLPKSKMNFGSFLDNSVRLNKTLMNLNRIFPISIIEGSEMSFAFLSNRLKDKFVMRLHGGHTFFAFYENRRRNPWKLFQEKFSFHRVKRFIAVSDFVGNETQKLLNVSFNYALISNTIEDFDDKCLELNKSILFVGSLVEKKGVLELFEAYLDSDINKEEHPLVFIGPDKKSTRFPDGFRKYVYKRLKEDNISDSSVIFMGYKPNDYVRRYMMGSFMNVLPSRIESQGIVWLEALLSSRPLICTDILPALESSNGGKYVTLVSINSVEQIKNAIETIAKNPIIYEDLAFKGRKFVLSKYNPRNILNKNIIYYSKINN